MKVEPLTRRVCAGTDQLRQTSAQCLRVVEQIAYEWVGDALSDAAKMSNMSRMSSVGRAMMTRGRVEGTSPR